MKLYSLCTKSHIPLKDGWFLPSLKDEFELELHFIESAGTGRFMEAGFMDVMLHKVDIIIEAIEENMGGLFVYSDVDVQFFAPTRLMLTQLMKDNDVIFQNNAASPDRTPTINAGFFMCRGNDRTLRFWKKVRAISTKNMRIHDQDAMNLLLKKRSCDIRWDYLPKEFYCPGRKWKPGDEVDIPPQLVMHHACWTIGIENKIAQLNYIKERKSQTALPG